MIGGPQNVSTPGVCPSWCTLADGHDWDGFSGFEQTLSRMHQGPDFGDAVSVSAVEYAGAEGHVEPLAVEVCVDVCDPAQAEDLARHLQDAAAWVRARSEEAAWWTSASNPACRPWCSATHEAGEFAQGASLRCERRVPVGERGVVSLAQVTQADERVGARSGSLELVPASVELEVGLDGESDYGDGLWSLESAAALAEEVPAALRTVLELAQDAGQDR